MQRHIKRPTCHFGKPKQTLLYCNLTISMKVPETDNYEFGLTGKNNVSHHLRQIESLAKWETRPNQRPAPPEDDRRFLPICAMTNRNDHSGLRSR